MSVYMCYRFPPFLPSFFFFFLKNILGVPLVALELLWLWISLVQKPQLLSATSEYLSPAVPGRNCAAPCWWGPKICTFFFWHCALDFSCIYILMSMYIYTYCIIIANKMVGTCKCILANFKLAYCTCMRNFVCFAINQSLILLLGVSYFTYFNINHPMVAEFSANCI